MAEITVVFNIKEEASKEKINEELNWYDTVRQKMLVFHGGKLAFKYKKDDYLVKMGEIERQRRGIKSIYRMLPEVDDLIVDNHFKINRSTNKEEIENWFYASNYINDIFMTIVDKEGMIFEVPDEEIEDFCNDLEGQGFKYYG